MDSDMIADLKQFISGELSQQTTDLRSDIAEIKQDVAGLKQDVSRLDVKTDEILDAVGDIMAKRDAAVDEQISDHEVRIAKLERRHA